MKNDKIKELKDNDIAQVTGGDGGHCHFEPVLSNFAGVTNREMPKPSADEKYIMVTSAPPAADIVDELKS